MGWHKDSLICEHLNVGILPIMACLSERGAADMNVSAFEGSFIFHNKRLAWNVNYFGLPVLLTKEGLRNDGIQSYVISPVDEQNKFSKTFLNCTCVVVAGQDTETGENISFMSHEDPKYFQKHGWENFTRDFRKSLYEVKNRCVPGTIDAVIGGGNFFTHIWKEEIEKQFRDDYRKVVYALAWKISAILGFAPVIITGPKTIKGEEHIFYENEHRRLYIFRKKVGDVSSESYTPKMYFKQERKWKEPLPK
ncbi:MAG: hypothetical protein NT098_03730 [Candidatus Parcubacteria bacterium]|nr:hypothetical protein [Candidatus Parcubacteria bacterium]